MEAPSYAIFLFPSVGHALKGEKILKDSGIAYKLIPIPREIATDCGVCLRFEPRFRPRIEATLRDRVETGAIVPL